MRIPKHRCASRSAQSASRKASAVREPFITGNTDGFRCMLMRKSDAMHKFRYCMRAHIPFRSLVTEIEPH